MVKPEWGTKRNCPKCGERFYDLNVDEEEDSPDNDIDLGGDDDLGVPAGDDNEDDS